MTVIKGTLRSMAAIAYIAALAVPVHHAYGGSHAVQFVDTTASAKITSTYDFPGPNRVPLRMRSGGAVGDFDRDGDQDLLVLTGGAAPDALYINQGDGTFIDEASAWGVARAHYGSGAAVGDVNNDGWLDIYITSLGPGTGDESVGQHLLYINNGNGTFTDNAQNAGVATTSLTVPDGFSASFGDYDLDGDLDLAVAGWMPGSGGNKLFRNDGTGRFTDVTARAIPYDLSGVRGFSPQFQDMDGDLRPDLLWVADFGTSRYFKNNGNGTFTDLTFESGTALDSNGMGSEIADMNGDGLPDWYVTSIDTSQEPTRSGNMLYINAGGHDYIEQSVPADVNMGGWAWGTDAADIDHDGNEDLIWTNGWIVYKVWANDPTYIAYNNGDGTFDRTTGNGLAHTGNGRGIATFDADNDGDRDVVVFSEDVPTVFYSNDMIHDGTRNWIRVFLDTSANSRLAPDGVGARVSIRIGNTRQYRWISASTNYLSQSELSAHFGLADHQTIDELVVTWQDGSIRRFRNVSANQTLTIRAPCPADIADPTSMLNVLDLLEFSKRVIAQDRTADIFPPGGDGITDSLDLLEYYRVFSNGCVP